MARPNGTMKAISPFMVALCFTSFSLCTQLRLPVGPLHISFPEIGAVASIALFWGRFQRRGPMATALFIALTSISIFAVFLAGAQQLEVAAARSLILPAALLLTIYHARLTPGEISAALWAFVLGAGATSLLAIQQAFMGSPPAFSIYQTKGFVDLALNGVMGWKLNLAQTSRLIPGQRALGFGMHLFSNNFGEFTVYAFVAVMTLWSMRRMATPVATGLMGLIGLALLTSLARTSWAGAALVIAGFAFIRARSILVRIGLTILGVIGAALMSEQVQSFLGFDRGDTLKGRAQLNQIALTVYLNSSTDHALLGGLAPMYWSYSGAFSYPHNSFLYLLINFGAVGCVLASIGMIAVAYRLGSRVISAPHDEVWIIALGGFLATVWMLAYGLTWTDLASSDSVFQWVIFAGMALSMISVPRVAVASPRPLGATSTFASAATTR